MITIILENEENQIIEKVGALGNRDYFLKPLDSKMYPVLSELSDSDNEIVTSGEMPQLIKELQTLKLTVDREQAKEIDEVIKLAKISETDGKCFLVFTPFGSFWKIKSRQIFR